MLIKGSLVFPAKSKDSAILEVAREDNGIQNQKEEKRRLFYVAITRAKKDHYIYTRLHEKSEFLNEISRSTLMLVSDYAYIDRIPKGS